MKKKGTRSQPAKTPVGEGRIYNKAETFAFIHDTTEHHIGKLRQIRRGKLVNGERERGTIKFDDLDRHHNDLLEEVWSILMGHVTPMPKKYLRKKKK